MNRDNLVSICSIAQGAAADLDGFLNEVSTFLNQNYQNYEIVLIGNGINGYALAEVHRIVTATPRARFIMLATQCDEDIAYSAALDTAIGDVVILMDHRHDPSNTIPALITKILNGAEIVLATPVNAPTEPAWYRLLASAYYRLVEFLVLSSLEFDRTYFAAYSRTAVNFITRHKSKIRNLRLLRHTLGLKTETIAYQQKPNAPPPRRRDLFNRVFARAEEALSFSVRPLRVVATLCLIAALVNICYASYVIVMRLLTETAPGWASSELAQSSMLSILFFALGILAMHLNIVMQEGQQRPPYTILHEIIGNQTAMPIRQKNVVG